MLELTKQNLFPHQAPDGQPIHIPVTVSSDDPYSRLTTLAQHQCYYNENGYTVLRNLIPEELCDQVNEAFEQEVRPFKGHIYRQTSSFPEKHQFTENGFILNSIKHIQDMSQKHFPAFVQSSFKVFTHTELIRAIHELVGEECSIVQTMCFEGNPATPAHYDSYYLDSAELGKMAAIWVALEDIHPGAGRFYIYPGSHKKALPKNEGDYEVSFHHDAYLSAIKQEIGKPGMDCHAPALRKGDVLVWNANTIHGSLKTIAPEYSRRSLTAHFIPRSKGYVLFQKVNIGLNVKMFNQYPVHCPKDPDKLTNQLQMFGLRYFPKVTDMIRKCVIRFRMSQE